MTLYTQPQNDVFASEAPASEIQDFEAWKRGLGIAFDETNGYPEMKGFNGLLNALSSYIKYLEQNGFAEWRNTMEYPQGAGVRVGMIWYRAKVRNTGKPPTTSQNEWEVFLNASALSYDDPLYIENNVVKIKTATSSQIGVLRFANNGEVINKSNVSAAVTPKNASDISQSTDIGVGQSVQNVTLQRAFGVTYYNFTGKPFFLSVYASGASGAPLVLFVDGVSFGETRQSATVQTTAIIPNGSSYTMYGATLQQWVEIRSN